VTYLVQWKGQELDIDPVDFSGLELGEIKRRTTYSFSQLITALRECDGDAVRALFWVAMRRTDPELKFGEFDGPPIRLFLQHIDGLGAAMDEGLGKDQTTPASDGSPPSSSPDVAEPTLML
jgi:hypothetical protein